MPKKNIWNNNEIFKQVNKKNINLLNDYILELKSNGKAEKTIYQYSQDIKLFFSYCFLFLDNEYILNLKKRDFRKFFLDLQDNGSSSSRINRVQCSIRNLLVFCENDEEEYEYEKNMMKSIKGLPGEKIKEVCFLEDEQITFLINHYYINKEYKKALYISLSYDSAARRNEVIQVQKHGFLENKMTNEVIGKRNKKFKLLYFDRTRKIASKYLEQRGTDNIDMLFVENYNNKLINIRYDTPYYWCLEFRKLIKDKFDKDIPFGPHSFRHSSLECYKNGSHYVLKELNKKELPLEVLKILAHHDSIETTISYLKNKDEELLLETFNL